MKGNVAVRFKGIQPQTAFALWCICDIKCMLNVADMMKLAWEVPALLLVSEEKADHAAPYRPIVCIGGCWGWIHYLYPLRNVFKAVLRLAGASPKIIPPFESGVMLERNFLRKFNEVFFVPIFTRVLLKYHPGETRVKVVAIFPFFPLDALHHFIHEQN